LAARKSKQTFEERLQQLEELIGQMENGGMTLEDTLKSYEKGVKLADELKKELTAAEERLTVLRGGAEVPAEEV
jgi:exodeoxyribonuclease VII small subunit